MWIVQLDLIFLIATKKIKTKISRITFISNFDQYNHFIGQCSMVEPSFHNEQIAYLLFQMESIFLVHGSSPSVM